MHCQETEVKVMGRYCENCGHELKAGAKFCPKCGNKIEIEEQAVEKSKITKSERLEEIYTNTYAKAYSVAIQMVKNKEDALDILQESYIAAFRNIDSLRDDDKVGAWINRIVANRCLDWLRKKKRDKQTLFTEMLPEDTDLEFEDSLENDNQEFMPEESIDYKDTKKIMQEILSNLSDEQRLCVLMYYYDELSVSEIAETLDCSTGTIKSRLNYARKYIKKEVEELEKKGTKLYGIAPIPFIVWMLTSQEHMITAEVANSKIWSEINSAANMNLERKIGNSNVETAINSQNKIDTKSVVQQAAQEVTKKSAKHVAMKIIAGVTAAAVVGAGGYVGYTQKHNDKNTQVKVSDNQDTKKEGDIEVKSESQDEKQEELIQKIDYDYIEKMCSYLPTYTSVDEISKNQLTAFYGSAFQYWFENKYCDKYHGGPSINSYSYETRNIISDDQVISEEETTVKFKTSTFDKFNQIAGIKMNPTTLDIYQVNYDGEEYVAEFTDATDNSVKCEVVGKGTDENTGNVLIQMEVRYKYSRDGLGQETVTPETVIISPADNDYGYQIISIEEGYRGIAKDVGSIATDVDENMDKILEVAMILGEFDANATGKLERKQVIGDGAVRNYANGYDVLLARSQTTDTTSEAFETEGYYQACELAGVSREDAKTGYSGQYSFLNDDVYMSTYENNGIYGEGTMAHFLRAEVDEKKDEVKLYFVSLYTNGQAYFDDFVKGAITVVPAKNTFGYAIQKITMEEWQDIYQSELYEKEKTAYEKADYGDSYVARDIMAAVQQSSEYWQDEMQNALERVEAKYPKYKEKLEAAQETYWENVQTKSEIARQEGGGSSLLSVGNTDATDMILEAAKDRTYYYICNFLMDNKIEILDAE